jgi:hypothetical protein
MSVSAVIVVNSGSRATAAARSLVSSRSYLTPDRTTQTWSTHLMHRTRRLSAAILAACLGPLAASSDAQSREPVRHIGVYVTPYYQAARTPQEPPTVSVAREFDARLASTAREDIVAVRDAIHARPQSVTPITLLVLAIRLYDVGLRDESVLWFYVAKNRFFTMADVLDMRSPGLRPTALAVTTFAELAGPAINSYAFCDFAKQEAAARQAVEWVAQNPYDALLIKRNPALPGDRAENLRRSIAGLREAAEKERQYLADPATREAMANQRAANGVPEQFCWGA